jgi:hypothetical protein
MAKKEKLTPEHKSESEWNRLYNAYLRQHSKKEMELAGNIDQTLTKVEFKGLYTSAVNEGIKTNITRKIVQSEAKVSYKQARVRMMVARNMLQQIQYAQHIGAVLSDEELAMLEEFGGTGGINVKKFRTNPHVMDKIDKYLEWLNRYNEGEDYSYAEFIDSP